MYTQTWKSMKAVLKGHVPSYLIIVFVQHRNFTGILPAKMRGPLIRTLLDDNFAIGLLLWRVLVIKKHFKTSLKSFINKSSRVRSDGGILQLKERCCSSFLMQLQGWGSKNTLVTASEVNLNCRKWISSPSYLQPISYQNSSQGQRPARTSNYMIVRTSQMVKIESIHWGIVVFLLKCTVMIRKMLTPKNT